MIINPNGMTFFDWATAVTQQLGFMGAVVTVTAQDSWIEWVNRILQLPQVSEQLVPRPGLFDDWLEWAGAFNRSVRY